MMWVANAIAWISTATGVIAGIYLTGSVWCLWAFFIPALMMVNFAKIYMNKNEYEDRDKDEMAD